MRKYLYYFFIVCTSILMFPAITMLFDMFYWFYTNETLSGLTYYGTSKPLVPIACTFLAVPFGYVAIDLSEELK